MQKEYKVSSNDSKILQNLFQNPEGIRITTLSKLTEMKPVTLYKRLNLLRSKLGLVENIFPIWKIVNGQSAKCKMLLKNKDIFELHNLSYVVPLVNVPDWWAKRSRKLTKLKGWQFKEISFGKGSSNPYQQLINENFVIQTYPESVIIIFRKRYYSNQPYEVIINAMNDFLDMWAWFEERMRFKFFIDGIPQIKLRSNDFLRVRDTLAEHCKKQDKGFLVEIPSKGRVWVDYSEPFGKEANYPEAQEILEKDIKDKLINKPMLNSELQLMVQRVVENQLNQDNSINTFAVALNRHIPAYEGMEKRVAELVEVIKELRKEIKKNENKDKM